MQDGQFSLYAQEQKAPEYKPLDFSRGYTPAFGPNLNGTLLDDPSLYDDASIAFQSGFTNQLNLFKQAWQDTKIGINSSDLMTALVKKANTSRALNQLEADFSLNSIDEVGYLTKKNELLDALNEAYLDIEESQSDVMRHEKRKNARPVSKDFLRKSQLAMLRGSDASLSDKFKYVLPSVAGSSFSTMAASLSAGFLGQLVKNAVVKGAATSAAGSVVPGLGNVAGFIAGAATVFGTNLIGRHLESKAEVGNQFNQDYEVLKDRYLSSKPAGYQLSEDEENELILKAAAGADEMYWKNMSLVVSDTIQSMIFAGGFAKAFNGLRNVNKTTRLLSGAGEFYLAKKLEGIEEGLQYAFGNRKSLESKGIEDDLGFISGLMRDYSDVVSSISLFGVKGQGPYSQDKEFDANVSAGELLGGLFSGTAVSARVAKDIYFFNQATKELKNLHPSKVEGALFQFKDDIYLNFFRPKDRGFFGILNSTSEDRVFYFKEALKALNKEVGEDGKPLLSSEELRTELSEVDKAYNIYQSVNRTLDEILPPFGKNNSKLSAVQKAAFRDVLFKNTMQSQRLNEKATTLESAAISSLLTQETTQQVPSMFVTKAKLVAVDERLKSAFGNYKEFLEKEKKNLLSELDENNKNYSSVANVLNQESAVALKNYYDSAENLYDLQKKHKELASVKSWNSLTNWFNNYKSNLKSLVVKAYEEENIEANKEYAKEILKTRKKPEELSDDEKKERLKSNLEILAKAGFSKSYIESLNAEEIETQATSALSDMSQGIQMMTDEAALYILSTIKDKDSLNAFLSTKRNKDKFLNLGFNDTMSVDLIKAESIKRFNEIQEINKASKKRIVRSEKLGDPTMSESTVSGRVKEKYDTRNTSDYEQQFKIVDGKANAKSILEEIINSPFSTEQEKELAKEYLKVINDDIVVEFKENWRPISKTNDTLIRKPGSTSLTNITIDLGFFGDEVQGNQSENGATSFEYTILHELTHHFTIKALREDQELRNKLNEIAVKAEAQAKKLNKEYYGLLKNTDGTFIVEELVAEAMTSPGFQALLMGVDGGESKTLWETFISAVLSALRKLFPGAEISGTALEEVINLTSSIISGNQPNITKAKKDLQALVDNKLVVNINDSKALSKLLEIYEDLLIELTSKANELELNEVVKTSILEYASEKMKAIESQIRELKKSKTEINFQGKTLKKGSYVALKSYDEPWKVLDLIDDGVELESISGSNTIRMTLTDASLIEIDGTITDIEYFIKKRDGKVEEYTSPQLFKSTGRQIIFKDGIEENVDPEDERFYAFLTVLSYTDFNNPKYYALLIKDEDAYKGVEIPKSKSTKEYLAAGGKRGEIAIIVDINGVPVKFNEYGLEIVDGQIVHFNIETPESIMKKDSGKIAKTLGIDIKKANELKINAAAKIKEARKMASEGTPVILKLTSVSEGSKVEDIVNQVLIEEISDSDINRVLGLVDYLSKNKHQEAKDFLFEFIISKNKDWKVSGGKIMHQGNQITPTYEDIKNNFTYKKSYQLVKDNKPFSIFSGTGEIEKTYPTYQDFLKTISNLKSNLTKEKYNKFLTYEIKGAFVAPKKHQGAASKLIKDKLNSITDQLVKTTAENATKDEEVAFAFLKEIVDQATGAVRGSIGNAREGAEAVYGKELVEAAIRLLGKNEPGIKTDEEVKEDDLFNDDDLFDSTVPQKQDNEYSNELGLFSNTDTYYLIRSIDKRIYNFLMNAAEKGSTKNIINIGSDRDFVLKVLDGVKRTLISSLEESKAQKNANAVKNIDDKINKISTNWSSIVDYYIQNSYIFNFAEDLSLQYDEDGNLITQEESIAKEKGFDNPGNTVSPIDGASKEIKALVRGLSRFEKINGKFVKVKNSFATADINNFSVTWNNLIRNLRGSSSFDDMLKKINDNKEAYPEYEELYNILYRYKINALNGNFESKLMISKFYKDFINPEIPIMEVLVDLNIDTTTFKLDEATRKNVKDLKKVFLENFKTKSTQTLKTSNGDIALNPAILAMPLNTKEERIAFLNALGFEFSEETLSTAEFDSLASKNNLEKYFKEEIKAVLDNGYGEFNRVVKDPITVLSRGVTKEGGIAKRINDLIALESKFSSIVPSLSMQNAEGNTEWAISRPNAYTTIIKAINDKEKYPTFQSLVAEPAYSFLDKPGAKTSIILNTIFILDNNKNYGKRRVINGKVSEIRLENISGSKIIDDEGLKTTSLFIGDKLVSDFNQLLKFGSKELMRAGDKNTSYGIKVPFYMQNDGSIGKLPISNIELFKGADGYGGAALESIFNKYLIGELHRIFLGRTDKINNINKISDGQERIIRKFSLFKSLLPEDVQNELYVKIDNLKDLDSFGVEIDNALESLSSEYMTDLRVKKHIYEFFRQEAVKKQKSLENYGFNFSNAFWVDDTLRKYGSATLLKAYVVNEFIIHVEQTKLFNGDIVFYASKDGEAHKRLPAFGATGLIPITDSWWVDLMNSDPKTNLQSKLLGVNNNYSNTVKTVVFREYHPNSVYINGWKEYLKSIKLKDEDIDKIIKPYFGIKEADAQGWITMDFYRSFKLAIGDWRVEQEKVYEKISKGVELSVNEVESLGRIFSPIKAQYAGPIHHEYIHVPAFHKFSLMPLLPSVIKGTKLEALNERMIRNNIGYALMETGSKLGTIKNGEMEAFYSKDGNMPDPTTPFINENLIYLNYLKEQVQIDPEIHDKVIFGTQFRKLLFQNVYSSGVAINAKLAKLEEEYSKIIEDITEFEKEALLYEMGVDAIIKDGKLVDYVVKDESKLAKKVLKEVTRRKLNNNIRFFFDYDKNKLKNPLDASLNHQQVRTLVLSMINNRLIRQTIKGDMMIQGAVTGYEKFTKPTDLDLEQYGTSGLRFYTVKDKKIRSSQVKLALTGDFKQLLNFEWNGEVIATRDRLNQALKDEKWVNKNRKAITLVGYRIPTQGLNSMEFMEVAEFLPPEAGSILIVPTEIVAKSGSDFDIDKLNVFKPTLRYDKATNRAYYVEYNKNKVSGVKAKKLAEKQELSAEFKDLVDLINMLKFKASENPSAENLDELLKWENRLREVEFENKLVLAELEELELYKGGLYNRIIELAVARLSDESSFVQLITPNSVDLLKPKVLEIQKLAKVAKKPYLHTNNLISSTQEEKYLAGIPNKRALGIAAVANVMSQLFNKVGVKINEFLFHPMIDNNDFSSMQLKDGNLKSEIESQMINGYVDVLNEDFISQANLSEQSAGAFFYLLHLGHDKDQLLYFFSHPVIKQYNLNLLNSNSILSKNFDYKVEKDYDLALYQQAIIAEQDFTLKTKTELDNIVKNKRKRQAFINIYNAKPNESLKKLINDGLDYAENNREIFSKNSLKTDLSKSLKDIPNDTKLAFLAYYNTVLSQSNDLLKLQQVNSFDTKATVNPMYYEFVELIKEKLILSGTFEINPEDLTNKTVIKPFNQGKLINGLLNSIFPVSLNKELRERAAIIYSSFTDSGNFKVDFDKFTRTFINDWMYFLLINLGVLNGKKFSEYKNLIFDPNVGNTLIDLKINKKWDQLRANYPIIQRFRLDRFEDLFNIALDRDDNSSDYQNTVIEQFTNLLNFSDNSYTEEDQQYIRSFFKDLGILGIMQSGLNKSPISFTDLIPIDLYINTMNGVVSTFKSLNQSDKDILLSNFISKFSDINTQFFGGQNKYPYWRFKDYSLTNKETFDSVVMPNVQEFKGFWTREEVAKQTDKVFLFGDNTDDRLNTKYIPSSTQAVIRGLPNAIGIDTKKNRATSENSYFTDNDFDRFKQQVDEAIKKAKNSGKTIVIPADGIGTGKAMLKEKAPKLFEYLQNELNKLKTYRSGEKTFDSSLPFVENFVSLQDGTYENLLKNLFNEGLIKPNCK